MRLLFFDPYVMGHHLEHPEHVMRYAAANQLDCELHFVVHPRFKEEAPDLAELTAAHGDQLTLHPLTQHEFEAVESSFTPRRVLATWNVAEKYARKVAADHCIFLEINLLQPALGLWRARKAPFRVSGTLFFPYCRIEPNSSAMRDRALTRLERYRKYGQVRWMLSNPQVHTLFVLNDEEAARTLNAAHDTSAFAALPDPVLPGVGSEDVEPPFTSEEGGRTHFLFFGSMREHKGVRQLVQAAHRLDEKAARRTALHVLGKARADLSSELPGLLDELRAAQPRLRVQHQDRFLDYGELESALDQCDVVLAPYQRTEGSSGVIGHAAKHGKPVLGPETGLVGALIREYGLGVTVDCTDPSAIARALRQYVMGNRAPPDEQGMARYAAERTPAQFARTILDRVTS